jgi:hypothetical protein
MNGQFIKNKKKFKLPYHTANLEDGLRDLRCHWQKYCWFAGGLRVLGRSTGPLVEVAGVIGGRVNHVADWRCWGVDWRSLKQQVFAGECLANLRRGRQP